jgi:hypothetical protein
MQISMPTSAQVNAFGRHVVSYSMGAVSMAVLFHVASPGDGQTATAAISQIVDGLKSVIAGATTLISFGMGIYAAFTAGPSAQIAAVAKSAFTPPEVKQAIAATVPAVAAVTPSTGA